MGKNITMINKSSRIAKFVFYLGITIAVLFGSASLIYISIIPEYTTTEVILVIFGFLPALAGMLIAYMGAYMSHKNKKLRGRRRH